MKTLALVVTYGATYAALTFALYMWAWASQLALPPPEAFCLVAAVLYLLAEMLAMIWHEGGNGQ